MLINRLKNIFSILLASSLILSCNDDSEPSFSFQIVALTYDNASKDFKPAAAHLGIASNNVAVITKELGAEISTISIPDKDGNLTVFVSTDGYLPYEHVFTSAELKQFESSPLEIKLLDESITEGLLAFYPFKGNASDSSGHNYQALVNGAVLTTDRKGNDKSSYYFDGFDDYISVAHNNAFNLTGDFAISLWALVSSSQVPHEGINDIIRKWNGNSDGYPYSISYLNPAADDAIEDKIMYARYDGQGCGNSVTSYSTVVANDEFIHIVLVKQGTKLLQYLNGKLIQQFTDNSFCSVANTANVTIGCRGNLVRFFKGKIDDIRFYNRSITEAEVANLFAE